MRKYLFSILTVLTIFSSSLVSGQSYGNLFFVFLNSNPDKAQISEQEVENLQAKHLDNLGRLAKEGIVKAAGPFDGGGGLLIMDAKDIESAQEILQSDPAIAANRFKVEVFPVMMIHGYTGGVKEPYKMVNYQFIRTIYNPDFFGDNDKYYFDNRVFMGDLATNNDFMVAHGTFNEENEGFLIINVSTAEEAQTIINKHPGVVDGQITTEIKTLWIAKGSFSEK